MAAIARIEPLSKFIDVTLREDLSPEAQSRALADFARAGIREARQHNARILGRAPRLEIAVDGRSGAALESVRPDGIIVAEFEVIDEALRWIAQTLVDRSPVRSGEYVRGHRIFADDREIQVFAGEPVPDAKRYTFLNLVPYARKVEVGKTKSGRDFLIQVPNRIYERTAKDAAARFGNMALIRFTYRAPMAGALLAYVSLGRGKSRPLPDAATRAAAGQERALRVPAIVVTTRG
jgi:hypothetical protein